jgi:hypothetical protein
MASAVTLGRIIITCATLLTCVFVFDVVFG